ncbi:acyl-CoA N-acyltransferase [Auriculariales sp. MPI-PUGE-AT-0066]|nr:acyl-CoA N-acyltransferase [Auriculariales sp. MPI-PUGE-AT-0066]
MSAIVVRPATSEDTAAIENVEATAFSDTHRIFPGSLSDPDGFTKFQIEKNRKIIAGEDESTQTWTVAQDTSTGSIAAIMRLEHVQNACEKPHTPITDVPFARADSLRFFNEVTLTRRDIMGTRPHFYVHILATRPQFQRRGCAHALLSHLFINADTVGRPIYLEASPVGIPFYKKLGFVEDGATVLFPCAPDGERDGMVVTVMVRKPQSM